MSRVEISFRSTLPRPRKEGPSAQRLITVTNRHRSKATIRSWGKWLLDQWAVLVFVMIVLCDQITKALVPRAWVTVDPATGEYLPLSLRRLYSGPITGALLDSIAIVLLGVVGVAAVRKLHSHLAGVGVIVLIGGMTSNLLDRLGLAAVTQGVKERGVVNWFQFGFRFVRVGNIGDCCYVVGILLIVIGAASRLKWSIEPTTRGPRWEPGPSRWWVIGTLLVLVIGASLGWTGFWQGDRRAALESSEITTYRANERAILARLDKAVITAYTNGNYEAAQLLPADQRIRCINTPSWRCSVVMAPSGPVSPGKAPGSRAHQNAQSRRDPSQKA